MITNGDALPHGHRIDTGLCIVGAGAAGLALARELSGLPLRVTVIESGPAGPEDGPDDLNTSENAGEHAVDLTSRRRGLGGATRLWGGNNCWFDPLDFEPRDHVPDAAWPFAHAELARFFPRASSLIGLGERSFDAETLAGTDPDFARHRLPLAAERIVTKPVWRWPLRFGECYRDIFETAGGKLDLVTDLTVTGLHSGEAESRIETLSARSRNGSFVEIKAAHFVLAAGIETVRLLLCARKAGLPALQTGHRAIGAWFMVHMNVPWGVLLPKSPSASLRLYTLEPDAPIEALPSPVLHAALQMAPEVQAKNRALNHLAFLVTPNEAPLNLTPEAIELARAEIQPRGIADWWHRLSGRKSPCYVIRHFFEQAPTLGRRLSLSDETDAAGLYRLRINWSVGPLEKHTMRTALANLDAAFREADLGRVAGSLPGDNEPWPSHLASASHFMGGARMGREPATSVVDPDCRVHNLENLYVAGAPVMPSGGANMVTCNLLALTLRLADHLKDRLGRTTP